VPALCLINNLLGGQVGNELKNLRTETFRKREIDACLNIFSQMALTIFPRFLLKNAYVGLHSRRFYSAARAAATYRALEVSYYTATGKIATSMIEPGSVVL